MTDAADTPRPSPRPVAAIRAELADVERFLRDAPPHSGSGARTKLEARLAVLRRELAAATRPSR